MVLPERLQNHDTKKIPDEDTHPQDRKNHITKKLYVKNVLAPPGPVTFTAFFLPLESISV